jgi:hypothetical protein
MFSAPHCRSLMEVVLVKKIRLNDEQWKMLQSLREANNMRCPTDSIKVSDRLRSNGLVAADQHGRKFLTDQGLSRLNQGR